jgi:hypothetical protein
MFFSTTCINLRLTIGLLREPPVKKNVILNESEGSRPNPTELESIACINLVLPLDFGWHGPKLLQQLGHGLFHHLHHHAPCM